MAETSFTNRQPSIGEGLDTLANSFDVLNQKLENIQATLNSIFLGQLPGIKIEQKLDPATINLNLSELSNLISSRLVQLMISRLVQVGDKL